MTGMTLLAAILGAGTGVGALLAAWALAPTSPCPPTPAGARRGRRVGWDRRRLWRLAIALAAGLLIGAVTGWPAAGLLAAAAAWALPRMIGPDHTHQRQVARIEAVATWTESLRDTLSAASGLEQAIVATAPVAPAAIRPAVQRLADRLRGEVRLSDALIAFQTEVDDATADLVAQALAMASRRHARHLSDLLAALAAAARDQAALRLRIAASRARIRTSTRVITVVTLALAAGLLVLDRGYLHPYDSPTGQMILMLVGALFGAGFWWLARIARIRDEARVFATPGPRGEEGLS